MRICKRCKVSKEDSDFGVDNRRADKLALVCKECNRTSSKKYREANKELVAKKAREYRAGYTKEERSQMKRQSRYGIKPKTLKAWLDIQNNQCAICKDEFVDGKFAVDHDHAHCSSSKACLVCIRGLLCHSCNTMLGRAKDNSTILRRGADYLDRTSARISMNMMTYLNLTQD